MVNVKEKHQIKRNKEKPNDVVKGMCYVSTRRRFKRNNNDEREEN